MIRSAIVSEDRRYRYCLYRRWFAEPAAPVLWIMLNPSTADDEIDDPTIRRCIDFTKSWGYGAMYVGNLYAYRATNPAFVRALPDDQARGPRNAFHLSAMADAAELVVCAWGASLKHLPETLIQVPRHNNIKCLGRTVTGQPKHPLYLSKQTPLEVYVP